MGQSLSEPIVDKYSANGDDDRLLYGLSAMQGWRISMEDAHSAILDLIAPVADQPAEEQPDGKRANSDEANGGSDDDKTQLKKKRVGNERISFFGVFDGHGGDKVARYAGDNIHNVLLKQQNFKAGDYVQALKDGFLATDSAILKDPRYEEELSGCTACVSLITDEKIYVANAGDSRSVLGVKGRAKPLSQDHKPQLEVERNRIQAAGGFVDYGRVNGNLALSRAIGDFEFKKSAELSPEAQIVTAYPDVEVHDITDDDEFMVIACDGIWDCQSSQAVVEFVRRGIVARQDLDKICENMMNNCLASNSETYGVGCDNMTMLIVGFLRGRSIVEWYEEIARRVAEGDGPCAPPEYADFRGPGVHHNFDNGDAANNAGTTFNADSPTSSGIGIDRFRGRIILLGDGTEFVAETDDTEMLDEMAEESDLESQVRKGWIGAHENAGIMVEAPDEAPRSPSPESRPHAPSDAVSKPTAESKPTVMEE